MLGDVERDVLEDGAECLRRGAEGSDFLQQVSGGHLARVMSVALVPPLEDAVGDVLGGDDAPVNDCAVADGDVTHARKRETAKRQARTRPPTNGEEVAVKHRSKGNGALPASLELLQRVESTQFRVGRGREWGSRKKRLGRRKRKSSDKRRAHEAEVDVVLVGIPLHICYDVAPPGPGDHEARRVVPEVQHHLEADAE